MDGRVASGAKLATVLAVFWFAHYVTPPLASVIGQTSVAVGVALILSLLAILTLYLERLFTSMKMVVNKHSLLDGGESTG